MKEEVSCSFCKLLYFQSAAFSQIYRVDEEISSLLVAPAARSL